jgi:predicted phage gp36 major capsid-like protein
MNNLFDSLIGLEFSSRPRLLWEMDVKTLSGIKPIKDPSGTYIWCPEPNYPKMPGALLGSQISIAKEECLQLKYIFPNGGEQVFKIGDM